MEEEKLVMRKLTGQDLFPMLKILSKVKVKDMVMEFIKKREEFIKNAKEYTEKEQMQIGMELFGEIINTTLANLELAKDDINKLLANLCSIELGEVEKLNMVEYTELILGFFEKEELADFFKCISSSKKLKSLI